ncbi:MAG: hydantoinase/oxoprolinase family protein [Actinomycetota bacterium]|nr:hydantoinase/oxoprolinase family protein [Actinomycetota bacterium]MDH5312653.1 hydantoinase/oxoprolinase family protein [Actinomycetota bacterium]
MPERAELRLGVDVGGTHTDAAILDRSDRLVASAKVSTSADVTGGVADAIAAVTARGVDTARVTHAMLGTTHATNAVLERRNLRRVAVMRLGGPATHAVRPLFGWPGDLTDAVSAGEIIVDGGVEFDAREIRPLDTDAIARFLASVADTADAVAITSVFAPVSAEHEAVARDLVATELGDVHVSLSNELGSIGLLERENATTLNAALSGLAGDAAGAFRDALVASGIEAVMSFAQNDGTLMRLERAMRFPVLTIGSGPANSLRGASYLTGITDALVVDVGGTSADVGALVNGFPRESSAAVEIGGIRTNFRMPDLVTIALGGGSVLSRDGSEVRVGPASVGFRLSSEGLIFGGHTPTLTDAAVAIGRARLGDAERLPAGDSDLFREAMLRSDDMLEGAINRMKTSREDRPVVVVGGGSIVVPDRIRGASQVYRPEHADVANAIGAAIAEVSGSVDRVVNLGAGGREAALREAREDAHERAVLAGAAADRVRIVELEEIPLAYLSRPAVRIRAKAAGPLDLDAGPTGIEHPRVEAADHARTAGDATAG